MTKLVPGICTQCGSILEVNPEQDAAICQYCGTPFIVDKAIEKYTIQSVESMNISNSIIQMGPTAENLLKRAIQFEENNEFLKAEEYYNKALDIDADNQLAHEGLERISSILYYLEAEQLFEDGREYERRKMFNAARECYVAARARDPHDLKYKEHLESINEKIKLKCRIVVESRCMYNNSIRKGNFIFDQNRIIFDTKGGHVTDQIIIPASAIKSVTPAYCRYFPQQKGSKQYNSIVVSFVNGTMVQTIHFYSLDAIRLAEAVNNILSGNY